MSEQFQPTEAQKALMQWVPGQGELQHVLELLNNSLSPDAAVQRNNQKRINELTSTVPEFGCYLGYVMCCLRGQLPGNTRAIAGLLLKNTLMKVRIPVPDNVVEYVKLAALDGLTDEERSVRNAAGTIVTTIFMRVKLDGWPDLLGRLLQFLNSTDNNVIDGTLSALRNLCEDSQEELDRSFQGGHPMELIMPRLIQLVDSENSRYRYLALACLHEFIATQSTALMINIDLFLQALFRRATDTDLEVRTNACKCLVSILGVRPDKLITVFDELIDYMLNMTAQSDDESLAKEACEFWIVVADNDALVEKLRPHLNRVIPILLQCMIYSEDDVARLESETADSTNVPDREQDIRPRHYTSQANSNMNDDDGGEDGEDDDDEDDDDDDDEENDEADGEWNLRKCASASLDVLSTAYGDAILQGLVSILEERLQSPEWPVREAAILALGAVAEGCNTGMSQYLPRLVPFLIEQANQSSPIVKAISCWTIGRYATWLVSEVNADHLNQYFTPVLQVILTQMLDNSKRVQESACSTLSIIEDVAGKLLVPYLHHILNTCVRAFSIYQQRNRAVLYDALTTLAGAVQSDMAKQEYLDLLMPALVERWNALAENDADICPLLECLSNVSSAFGTLFIPYAGPMYERCLNLINTTLFQAHQYREDSNAPYPEMDYVIVALDLICGIVQALGPAAESLVASGNGQLLELLKICLRDPNPEVRQSAYGLLGDLTTTCFAHVRRHVPDLLKLMLDALTINPLVNLNVTNNVAWAAGEIAVQMALQMRPYTEHFVNALLPILIHRQVPNPLAENIAIALGRFGLVAPDAVAPHLENFAEKWCQVLARLQNGVEKDQAFRGLCAMIDRNPFGIARAFPSFCAAVAFWSGADPSQELNTQLAQVFVGLRGMCNDEQWESVTSRVAAEARQVILARYGV
ncbi:Transportin-PC [Ramicandelaber brevisporus]|nr:Transportin-PC [Ramicandelaber brevisporus]